ncbi:MAG TPA: acetyl-CoA carboxylase biotin carboxyl carrier protein [Cyclobacteriaceae bacterium]|nr:acetyl-CoA carboxylase biotin carboxyl carrier protein [Cyclobacteriaceae bacterium]
MSKTRAKSALKKRTRPSPKKASTAPLNDMKTREIRDLIDFIANTGLNEVNIETAELKLHVKRQPDQWIKESSQPVIQAPAASSPQTVAAQLQQAQQLSDEAAPLPAGKPTVEIKSPMIGTFYRTPNPDSPPFVSVGDKITKGQTVCIIEAMKLFNEIESEVSGTIVKALVENATPVEYDQPLYVVEPD